MDGALPAILLTAIVVLAALLLRAILRQRHSAAALAALQAAQAARFAHWETTIASMPDGLMVLGADLCLADWNEHFPEFSGVPPELLRVGLPLRDMLLAQAQAGEFGPVDPEREADRRAAAIAAGQASGTIERQRPNGQVLELRRNPMPGGGFVTLYTDITGRRRVEEQLRQSQKMEAIGQLTGGVAHDFNNLLTVILGNLDMARVALEAGNVLRARDKLDLAEHGAQRAATLTQRLVAFSRRQTLDPQPVDANRIVAGMTEFIRHAIGSIELETVLAGELWQAVVDPNQLENALLNLAINARDAMPAGGKLTIETANAYLDAAYAAAHVEVTPGQYVQIAVTDTGSGMSPEHVEQAFEPFFTTKEVGKGSGLGLSQVFGFIKQSNGHVKIYSELGVGTTVKLYLPRMTDALATAAGPLSVAVQPETPRAGPHETIVVVEDDADVLAYSADVLTSLGYEVIATRNAAHALWALDTQPEIVLLFTDLELPGLNGQELAQEALRRRPGLAVLYTTGYPTNAILHNDLLGPKVKVISKPFALAELAATVRDAIDHPA